MSNAKVSICVLSYNHEKFIEQSLDSLLAQKTNFPFQLVIGDDNSTDSTQEILRRYAAQYPDKIKLLLNKTNIGVTANCLQTISHCDAEYIAFCEGDDYWTDDLQLQKKADFLDNSPDYNVCVSQVKRYREDTGVFSDFTPLTVVNNHKGDYYTLKDYMDYDCLFHTSSFFFRNIYKGQLPSFMTTVWSMDQAIFVLYTLGTKIKFFPEATSVYRMHPAGITNSKKHRNLKRVTNNQIQMFSNLDKFTAYRYHQYLHPRIQKLKYERVKIFLGLPQLKRRCLQWLNSNKKKNV